MPLDADFIVSLFTIIAIDIVLGGDNAIVIAMACRNLPVTKRNKAIVWGIGAAVIVRVLLTIIVLKLLQIPYLELVGGLLLIVIAYKLLIDDHDDLDVKGGTTLFGAIRTIIFADLVMGIDNVVAVAGAADEDIFLVICGLLISIPVIIWGSKLILRVMEQFPSIIYLGGAILAFTSGRMITDAPNTEAVFTGRPMLTYTTWFVIILGVLCAGWTANKIKST